jgi:altronate hydrolase
MNDFIKINPHDDVMVVLKDFHKGDVVNGITLLDDVKMGHKIALHDMEKGHHLIKYGNVIGVLSVDVKKGNWIHSHNLHTSLEEGEPTYHYNKNVREETPASTKTWMGFLRSDGEAGTRNDFYIIPTVGCINNVLEEVKEQFLAKHPEMKGRVKILAHPYGCSQLGDDLQNTARLLAALAHNPNAGGVLIVGLGCENNRMPDFLKELGDVDESRVKYMLCQDYEDEISEALSLAEEIYDVMKDDKRVELPLSKLRRGLKCGGSDGFSGLTANPLVGLVSDVIGASGGKVALTEVPEMFGAEQMLMNRAKDEETFHKVVDLINNFKAYYARNNQPCYENPSPGNKDGGITTLEEKSNGCVLKGGALEINDVLDVGEKLKNNKLTLVNGPGNDLVASTNLAAAGCTIMFFTTGRGTPFGSVIPTIKVGTQHKVSSFKSDWIDFDGGKMLDEDIYAVRDQLLDLLIDVASGRTSARAERSDRGLIALFKTGVTL